MPAANKLAVHFSSGTIEWYTPNDLFDDLNARWGPFDLDVCATHENAKCLDFITKDGVWHTDLWDGRHIKQSTEDGLTASWRMLGERCFMNPPYGRGISAWVKKAYEESRKGCLVVCLLPARTDTQWFHTYCTKGEIEFLKGRLKFGGAKNSAPFPSMIVVFRPKL